MNKSNIYLIGNKNVGKTTIYNHLTNQTNKVGNFSGVTTSKSEFSHNEFDITDLPGLDTFSVSSDDEQIVIDYINNNNIDQLNLVLDSSNIEKSTFLLCEILELNLKTNICLNQFDLVNNVDNLQKSFTKHTKTHVITNSIKKQNNFDQYLQYNKPNIEINYGLAIESAISEIILELKDYSFKSNYNYRFLAIQLLLKNKDIFKTLPIDLFNNINIIITKCNNEITKKSKNSNIYSRIHMSRKMFVEKIVKDAQEYVVKEQNKIVEKLDNLLISLFPGLPIMFIILGLGYYLAINIVGLPLQGLWTSILGDYIQSPIDKIMSVNKYSNIIVSLVDEVIFSSLGTIIGFIPLIVSIYVLNAIIELTGYMSRVIVLVDRVFSLFNLSGRAIGPLVSGFGCNVPAILTTRNNPNRRERIITSLIIPFMPCSARLPIITLIGTIFFKAYTGLFILSINIIVIIIALISAKIFTLSMFKKTDEFVLYELPKLKMPQIKYVIKFALKISLGYVRKIYTTLLVGSLVVWLLTHFGMNGFNDSNPFIKILSYPLKYVLMPLGIDNYLFGGLFYVGFIVKELVLTSMPIIFNNDSVNHILQTNLSSASAFSFILFNVLYIPCLSTYKTLRDEFGNKIANISVYASLSIAYIISIIAYNILKLFGL